MTLPVAQVRALLLAASHTELDGLLGEYAGDERAGVRAACDTARRRRDAVRQEDARLDALYAAERELYDAGCIAVAGADEVGRGALAGPLTVGAVVLPASPRIRGLNDSKQLSPAKRTQIAEQVREIAVAACVAHVEATDIDALGVTAALRLAFSRAVIGLGIKPDRLLIDGRPLRIHHAETAIVKGDSRVAAIAAASVIAKVERDTLMVRAAQEHPEFEFDVNKGYGTAEHIAAIAKHGPCPLHRRSFSLGDTPTLF